jgi:hypothetical protein
MPCDAQRVAVPDDVFTPTNPVSATNLHESDSQLTPRQTTPTRYACPANKEPFVRVRYRLWPILTPIAGQLKCAWSAAVFLESHLDGSALLLRFAVPDVYADKPRGVRRILHESLDSQLDDANQVRRSANQEIRSGVSRSHVSQSTPLRSRCHVYTDESCERDEPACERQPAGRPIRQREPGMLLNSCFFITSCEGEHAAIATTTVLATIPSILFCGCYLGQNAWAQAQQPNEQLHEAHYCASHATCTTVNELMMSRGMHSAVAVPTC